MKRKNTVGSMIRSKREAKKLTREKLAIKMGISPGYLGHIECGSHVHFSEKLKKKAEKALSIKIPQKSVDAVNEKSRRWYKAYRAGKKKAA